MDDTTKKIVQMALAGLIRHGMTTAAGVLVTAGLLQSSDSSNFVEIGTGIGIGLIALGWSWWQKAGQAKLEALLRQAKTPAKTAALALFALVLTAMSVHAQTKPAPAKPLIELNGPCNPLGDTRPQCQGASAAAGGTQTPEQTWQQIVSATMADLTYAKALADYAGTANSKLRSQCYAALIDANKKANGIDLKDANGQPISKPDPALISDAERGLQAIDNLQPSSPLMAACAPAANAVKLGALSFINTVVTGAALKAVTGGILP